MSGSFSLAQTQEAKPNFSGKWQLNTAKSQTPGGKPAPSSLTIDHKDPAIHIVRAMPSGKSVDIACTTTGKDCDAQAFKTSLWYDAKALVEMDVSDEQVLKISLTLSADGKTLTAEVTYLSPRAEQDTLVYERR